MKLSIVTVNKNNSIGLKETIDSVRSQLFKDFEFIIIDGDSTDDSKNIINNNKDIINESVSEADNGVYDAMNKALKMCNGEYVIFMNSGDKFYDPSTLKNVFSKDYKSDVLYGDVYFDKFYLANKNIKSLQDFYCRSPFCHQGAFTRTELARKIKFNTDYRIVSDWIMFYQLFTNGYTFEYVPEIIAKCERGGLSSNFKRNNEERIKYLSNIYPQYILNDYNELNKIKSGTLWDYYQRLENTKKIKYYILKLLKLFRF